MDCFENDALRITHIVVSDALRPRVEIRIAKAMYISGSPEALGELRVGEKLTILF